MDPTDPTDPTDPIDPTDPAFPVDPSAPPEPAPDKGDRDIEGAIAGLGALPIFIDPYTISERLVGWGFGGEGGRPMTNSDGPDRRAWFEADGLRFDDDRYGRHGDGWRTEATIGFDLVRNPELVLGLAGGWENSSANAFSGSTKTSYDGYFFGPYAAFLPQENMVLDLWLGYARRRMDSRIAELESEYDVDRLFVSANATARYMRGGFELRPKFEFFYSDDDTASHAYRGRGGAGVAEDYRLWIDGASDDLAVTRISAELRRTYRKSGGTVFEPFARAGVDAYLARPYDGRVLDDQLELRSTDAVTGDLEAGLVVRFASGGRAVARVAIEDIGSGGLDSYGGQIALEFPF